MNIGQMNEDMVVTNCGDYAYENEIDWVYM
jgi:hypothetical protein